MPGFVEQLGMQAAGQTLGAGMGLILGGIERKKQLEQQQKLQNMQIAGQMEMGRFNQKQALEMWEATNYSAQMAQLRKAGLNPGLIYGMGGAGGAIANPTQGQVTGGNAAPQGPAQGMAIASGQNILQMQLLEAQKRNIDADTANKQAQTTKTAGVDTQKVTTEIEGIKQTIDSQKSQQALTNVQTQLAKLDAEYQSATMENRKSLVNMALSKIIEEVAIINNDRQISDATKNDAIKRIKGEAIKVYLENALIKSQTNLTQDQIRVNQTSIEKMISDMQNTDKMTNLEDLKTRIMDDKNFRDNLERNEIGIDEILRNIGIILPIPGGKSSNPIRGFHDRK